MKISVVFVFLATLCFAMISAQPATFKEEVVSSIQEQEFPSIKEFDSEGEGGFRFKRATCDLLSVDTPIGSLNHAACAAHCLTLGKGFKGGRCRDGVCHCRR